MGLGAALLALFATGYQGALSNRENRQPLFLNAASQDRALFLTWNTTAGSRDVSLYWRRVGSERWHKTAVADQGFHLVDALENGVTYECYAERNQKIGIAVNSSVVRQTPRRREFHVGRHYFTGQPAADRWLRKREIDPSSLRLQGQAVKNWGPGAPDGIYMDQRGSFLFLLLRHADDHFEPPSTLRSPSEVRSVLLHALWRRSNPFDDPHHFDMPIAPVEPPIVGNVRGYATARSFVVTYHPQLSSRCTRFIPFEPAPGKFAIYIDGHEGATVEFGAEPIVRLLKLGWQVIAMDMPLIGLNEVDRTATLRSHDSFASWPPADTSPVALFLQPLKAVVDQIYAEMNDPSILLIGKSGGGWTSYMYGALDGRIDYVVNVAGGMPMAQWVRRRPIPPPDYEQVAPRIFGAVRYTDIMPIAGSRGAFYVYNEHDPCCFNLKPNDSFIRFLRDAATALDKPIGVYVDRETRRHTFSAAAFDEVDRFLRTTEQRRPRQPEHG